jgi:hypothetical protein
MKHIDALRHGGIRVLAVGVVVAAVAGGIAYAAIPGEDGVISACRHKISGALRVIDSSATCNASTELPLNWNQSGPAGSTGPTGPPGPSDAYSASNDYSHVGGADTTLVSVAVPAGSYAVAAKSHLYNAVENSFAICELRAGATRLDGNINRLIAPANDQVVPFLGAVTLPSGGTVSLVCNGNGVTTVESEDSKLVATKVGALH